MNQCHRFNVTDLPQRCSKHQKRTRCKGSFYNVTDCPNGAANTRNALGARAHFTVSLISNCRWGIGAIAVLPGVSLWINQRLNPFTLGVQPFKKVGQCHRFNVTDSMSQKDRKTENGPTEEQKDRKTDRTTEKQEDRSSIFLFGPVGEVLVTVRSPTHGAQQSYLRMHSPPRGWLALSTKLENNESKNEGT